MVHAPSGTGIGQMGICAMLHIVNIQTKKQDKIQLEGVLSMGLMNVVASSVRHRIMPRRRSGMGTMTALFVGASVGIAAWEAVRKAQGMRMMGGSQSSSSDGGATALAEEVMREIES